jgi:methionine-rich copper-binding protein CopC/phage baseplate assembly protein gpV
MDTYYCSKRLIISLIFSAFVLFGNYAVAQTANINFQPSGTAVPAGYTADIGLPFDATRKFGWISPTTKQPIDLKANMRLRSGTGDFKQLSLVQMQATTSGQVPGTWEYAVANGRYRVTISAGDNNYFDSDNQINVENLPTITDFIPTSTTKFRIATAVVQVNDGKLTIDATGGVNTKMDYLTFLPATTVSDASSPTASARFSGSQSSANVYNNQVQVFLSAVDVGASGLASLQYAINGGSYINYRSPLTINIAGAYTLNVKATDDNKNEKITTYNFSVTTPKVAGVYMSLKNMDLIPANDVLLFSLIQKPWRRTSPDTTPYNANHDKVRLRVYNLGTGKLNVTNLKLSNTVSWKIASINNDTIVKLPFTVNSKAYSEVIVQFKAKDAGTRITILNDTLSIVSNDSIAPTKKVMLHGIWQAAGEGVNEPYAQQIISAFGYKTITGYSHDDGTIDGKTRVPNSSEVDASYFIQADKSKPITINQLAAYHGCCSAVETISYYAKGSTSTTRVFTHNNLYGQSVVPRIQGSSISPAQGSFNFSGSFGFKVGSSFSDRTKNINGLIGIRILKAMDPAGNIIPNAYIFDCDYLGTQFTNYDYQDNVYYVENIKPESGSVNYSNLACITSSDVSFANTLTGATTSAKLTLKNMGMQYPDGTSDPDIKLTSIKIVGPNAAEFSSTALTTTTLAVQASTSITASFKPTSVGIKNAALLVYFNSALSPLRIPLYGIANNSTSTVALVKRIKGGSDVNLTIGNKVFEADKSYRGGSVKLDMQVVKTSISSTDIDALYQTYLSAATDLAATSYAIPITNGDYLIRMHFAENYWTAPGSRVFSTSMEGKQVQSNFDIYSEVGYRAALVKDVKTTVSDGILNINFTPTANRLAIAGLEIFKVNTTASSSIASTSAYSSSMFAIQEEAPASNFVVYPNPSSGENFSISAQNFISNEKVTVNIINAWGVLIQTQDFTADEIGGVNVPMPLKKNLDKGVYIIQFTTASKTMVSKLLVK